MAEAKANANAVLRNPVGSPRWKAPVAGCWKINTDAASNYKERLIGLGVICRDWLRLVKLAAAQKMIAMVSPLMAETLAIKYGLQLACEAGFANVLIESDLRFECGLLTSPWFFP
ncbi:hypothetical protein Q3G72_014054 [Acer saccharum]|nr:hypothetical protein Q3G72_014054 [Acer saccharum]